MKIILGLFLTFALAVIGFGQNKNHSGAYYRKKGDVTFKEIGKGKNRVINFEIYAAGAVVGTCVGHFNGKAKWIAANIAEYNGDFNATKKDTGEPISCRLTFVFSGNQVSVRETNCDEYHGMECNFEGTYKRKSQKKRKRLKFY